MKKMLLFFISFLCLFVLIGCNKEAANKNKYKLTVIDEFNYLYEPLNEYYEEGEEVRVFIKFLSGCHGGIYLNGEHITNTIMVADYAGMVFTFIMPNKDSILYTTSSGYILKDCGSEDLHQYDEGKPDIFSSLFPTPTVYTCILCGNKKYEDVYHQFDVLEFAKEEKEVELIKFKELILFNVDDSIKNDISIVFDKSLNDIKNSDSISKINDLSIKCIKDIYSLIPVANGSFDFSEVSDTEKEKILSLLDQYILRNNLSGVAISKDRTLNLNSTTKDKWIEFFGVNGIIKKTSIDNYWDVKPLLSNKYFLKGLNLCLDKELFIDETGISPIDYSKYEFYNYNLVLAKKYFSVAINELIEEGVYNLSSSTIPTELKLEIAFGSKTERTEKIFNNIKNCIETAFNDQMVSNGSFKLTVKAWYGEFFGQIYTSKLYNGQYDISYDKISGSSSEKYMHYKLLSTSPYLSKYMTTNWSIDTNNIEEDCIVYNGYRFSYDSLLSLLISKQIIINGQMFYIVPYNN